MRTLHVYGFSLLKHYLAPELDTGTLFKTGPRGQVLKLTNLTITSLDIVLLMVNIPKHIFN